jgi:hypothetical protein
LSDRKYRHSGYQDSGSQSKENRPQGPRPDPRPERLEGAPRGRTAGGFGPEAFKCNECSQLRHGFDDLATDETCTKCNADMHTCANCRFFDTTTLWECRENIPARVAGKRTRNECTFFAPKIVRDLAADKSKQPMVPDDARKAFDALFKK